MPLYVVAGPISGRRKIVKNALKLSAKFTFTVAGGVAVELIVRWLLQFIG